MKYFCYDCQKVYTFKQVYRKGQELKCPYRHMIHRCFNALRLGVLPIDTTELFSDCNNCKIRFNCWTA